jgi:hypothetical protein
MSGVGEGVVFSADRASHESKFGAVVHITSPATGEEVVPTPRIPVVSAYCMLDCCTGN